MSQNNLGNIKQWLVFWCVLDWCALLVFVPGRTHQSRTTVHMDPRIGRHSASLQLLVWSLITVVSTAALSWAELAASVLDESDGWAELAETVLGNSNTVADDDDVSGIHGRADQLGQEHVHTQETGEVGAHAFPEPENNLQEETLCGLHVSVDPKVKSIGSVYYGPHKSLHTTKEAITISKLVDIEAVKIEPILSGLSAALWQLDKMHHHTFIEALLNSGAKPVAIFDICKYDETPMRVTHGMALSSVATGVASEMKTNSEPGVSSQALLDLPTSYVPTSKSTSTSKLLASDHNYVVIFAVGDPSVADAPQQVVTMCSTCLSTIQFLERGTGSCVAEALQKTCCLPVAIERFPFKLRLVTTDKGSANPAAEVKTLSKRVGWCNIHLKCCVHTAANIHTKSLCDFSDHITGLVNLALYLRVGENMVKWRQALATIIVQKFTVVREEPTWQMEEYRQWVLSLMCSTGAKASTKRLMLNKLVNGNWRRKAAVFVPQTPLARGRSSN
eukprot:6107962-Amphidinium_carterae.3